MATPTHKQKVLALLRDGRPHTHMELYRLGCVAHSRIADLRRDGHTIATWREGDNYIYQLRPSLDETQTPLSRTVSLPSGRPPSLVCVSSNEDSAANPAHPSLGELTTADDDRGVTRGGGQLLVLFPPGVYPDAA